MNLRKTTIEILQKEAELEEIVKLIGIDSVPKKDRLLLETAKSIREDFLHQHAYDEVDTYTPLRKQMGMLEIILMLHRHSEKELESGALLSDILNNPIRREIPKMKFLEEEEFYKKAGEVKKQL